ncbi:xanthine dehydrogenase small subunit [Rhizobium sp. CFBP 8762]|uniref:xanthine dehydrogenase small subunit n=1 Tax=Rhizobium sp. CFBP 8762 TaxID=2775279 RepID=UPI00177C8D62|nr:xanthine dehydrogenase small subunit [Rhizobium sp. CFBP 8762]MBD8556534.1 xanthine dehydrogenase small subunit [Rhizobium sp. CFBP 8762]
MTDTKAALRFILNDADVVIEALSPTATLLDYLRLERRLTGTKEGCAEGDCGACTVLIGRLHNGQLRYETVNACIRFVGSLQATHVVTVEHLSPREGTLHPVQQAMVDYHGSQCGFCTPGFIMSLYGLWLSNEAPGRAEIERALQGNLCRCTGYEPIIRAAEAIAASRPDALFDPLLSLRTDITNRLTALDQRETIRIGRPDHCLMVPGTVDDLATILDEHPEATVVAGSTDVGLWVTKQMRALNPLVFINNLSELQRISHSEDGITLGAGVTYATAFETLSQGYPALRNLLNRLGGEQVRSMGTIGGNIANGSPIGDTPPALIALGASITLRSAHGRRTMLLEDFFIDYGKQDRAKNEFVESIFVPVLEPDARFAVYKISKRRDEDISALCGAFHLVLRDNIVTSIRIAFGGMAATPKRAPSVEAALIGQRWTQDTINAALNAFAEDYQPLSDWRASAEYRLLTARNLLTRFYLESLGHDVQLRRFAEVAHG